MHVYRIALAESAGAKAPLPLPDNPSLAVLPFQNMTGDTEQDYFVDGIVEEMTAAPERPARGARLCMRAFELDPIYAPAAGLAAWCRTVQKWQGWISPAGVEYAEGIELARQAIVVGKDDPDTLWMAAHTLAYLGAENATGVTLVDRALALNPQCRARLGRKGIDRLLAWRLGHCHRRARTCHSSQPGRPPQLSQ